MSEYYLYRHIRKDINVPFYVGIGKKEKKYNTEKQEFRRAFRGIETTGRTKWWYNVYKKTNGNIDVEILYTSNSIEDIKSKEIEFIKLYGRINKGNGTLVNLTDGGDGCFGLVMSKESVEKIRKANTGRNHTPEVCERIRQANIGHSRGGWKFTEEQRKHQSLKAKGRVPSEQAMINMKLAAQSRKRPKPFSEEHLKNLSIASKNKIRTPEWCNKISEANIGKPKHNAESRKKISEKAKGRKASAETRAKMSAYRTGRPLSEETKAKMRKPKSEEHRLKIKAAKQKLYGASH